MHDDDDDDVDLENLPDPSPFDIGLEGKRWNVDRFFALEGVPPEKMELIDGKLFWARRYRLGMLAAMLEQLGLVEAVKLAPKELWLEALRRAED